MYILLLFLGNIFAISEYATIHEYNTSKIFIGKKANFNTGFILAINDDNVRNRGFKAFANPDLVSVDTIYPASNVCPASRVDLTAHVQGVPPVGTIVTWHTALPTTNANRILNPTSVGSGTYYAVYYDSVNDCFSGGGNAALAVNVTINPLPNLIITNPTVCSPNVVNLTAPEVTFGSTLQSGVLSYWNNIEATMPLTTPTSINSSGIYFIKVETPQGCTDIKPINVTVNRMKPLKIVHGPWVGN